VSKRIDPKNYDYNKDTYITESDWDIGKKDLNKDGKVTSAEEKKYTKQQTTTVSTTTETPGGGVKTETQTPPVEEEAPRWSREKAAAAGFTREFLKRNPDIIPLLKLAIKNNWTEEEFNQAVRKDTKWGQSTTTSERQFDLAFYGEDPNTIKKTLETNQQNVFNLAKSVGVTLSEEDLKDFSFRYTRSGLSSQDIYDFIASKYGVTPPPTTAQPAVGTASMISDRLRQMARSYGVTITPDTLTAKIREGIQQGERWETWLEGQRNLFRQSAKTLYANVSDKLDEYTLEELVDPYLEDASNLLGIPRKNMDLSNPMWTKALTGANGKPMTRDEWLRTLRMDKQYGWNNTQRAKTEMAELGDELLSAFGMA
jgi:hypothetical protein